MHEKFEEGDGMFDYSLAISTALSFVDNPNGGEKAPGAHGRQKMSEGGNSLPRPDDAGAVQSVTGPADRTIRDSVQSARTELQFEVNETTNSTVVTVQNAETGELLRQIPSREMIAIAQYIADIESDLTMGTLIDHSE